jgi:hypothetical protein
LLAGRGDTPALFQVPLIHIAPDELLAGRYGFHDRMAGRFVVFGRMFVLRTVAAADMAAGQTLAQADPRVAERDAFGADGYIFWVEVVVYLADVGAGIFEMHIFILL